MGFYSKHTGMCATTGGQGCSKFSPGRFEGGPNSPLAARPRRWHSPLTVEKPGQEGQQVLSNAEQRGECMWQATSENNHAETMRKQHGRAGPPQGASQERSPNWPSSREGHVGKTLVLPRKQLMFGQRGPQEVDTANHVYEHTPNGKSYKTQLRQDVASEAKLPPTRPARHPIQLA